MKIDNRKNNGGHSTAGRKPKIEEEKLIEMLDKHIDKDLVLAELKKQIFAGKEKAMQLYFNYRFGKPKETIDLNSSEGLNLNFKELINFK